MSTLSRLACGEGEGGGGGGGGEGEGEGGEGEGARAALFFRAFFGAPRMPRLLRICCADLFDSSAGFNKQFLDLYTTCERPSAASSTF